MFSGGVGEYVYGRETRDFGDMGRRLGRAVRRRIDAGALPWPLLPAGECIRATALGASEYTVQLSGNTSYISDPAVLLPRRNLQVLQPPFTCEETIDSGAARGRHPRAPRRVRRRRTRQRHRPCPALAGAAVLRAHSRLRERASASGMSDLHRRRQALYIMLDGDVAQTLGSILREELRVDKRDPVDRRGPPMGLRLHRPRPHPDAVEHRSGDHQIPHLQRGSAAGSTAVIAPPPSRRRP